MLPYPEIDDEVMASAPVDELALGVLNEFASQEAAGSQPQRWNELNRFGEAQYSYAARRALSEALVWLEVHGLVTPSPDTDNRDHWRITQRGIDTLNALKAGQEAPVRAAAALNVALRPDLERRVRRQFLMGEYELAAVAAMKEVEIRVRTLGGFTHEDVGVDLMRRAFGPKSGALADPEQPPGEQRATMDLFAGAFGLFRNPPSHRRVHFDDPNEAAEVVMLADLLMRLLDRRERAGSEGSP